MSKFTEYIGSQFGNPRGIIGKCCCIIMNIINKAMYNRVVSMIQVPSEGTILDIGYGNGYLLKRLFKKHQPHLFGIDISEDMKNNAIKKNVKAFESGKLKLAVGDCCALPYESEFFDVVTSINTIYFWNDTMLGLMEICRCLKKSGKFYNVVYTKEWLQKFSYTKTGFTFFEQKDYIEFASKVGFSKVRIQDIVKGKSFVVIYEK